MFGFIPYKKHTTFCRSIAAQRKTRNLHDYGFFSFMKNDPVLNKECTH